MISLLTSYRWAGGIPYGDRSPARAGWRAGSGCAAGDRRRAPSTLCSRPGVKPGLVPRPGRVRPQKAAGHARHPAGAGRHGGPPDLTPRAEPGVDTAGPGWQASQTCPPARDPAPGEGGGRSAPEAAIRDPRHSRRPPRAPAAARGPGPRSRRPAAGTRGLPARPALAPIQPPRPPAAGGARGGGLDSLAGAERGSCGPHGQAPPADTHRWRPGPRRRGRRTGRPCRKRSAADHRGGDRGAAGVPDHVLPLAAAGHRAAGGTAARRRRADPAQRAPAVAAPPGQPSAGGHRHHEQLRRQILGPQEDRRHRQGPLAGPVERRRAGALPVLPRPAARRRLPHRASTNAVRDRQPVRPGHRPARHRAQQAAAGTVSWYEHARAYTEAKWPHLAPISRRSAAEALTTVTVALVSHRRGAPDPAVLRRALFAWAFNPGTRNLTPPAETASALDWIAAASLPVTALQETPPRIRLALGACARTRHRDTSRRHHPAAQARRVPQRRRLRRRAAAAGRQPDRPDPVESPRRRPDRRPPRRRRPRPGPRACSPPSAPSATAAQHLEAFYGCLYYAALRPSEAVMLRESRLPSPRPRLGPHRPGRLRAPGRQDWTDDGTARQARGLKHRAQHETRSIPIPPVLVQLLRAHLKRYGTAPDGRIFRTARGGLIQDSAYSAVWAGRPRRRAHPRPARLPAGPPPLRPAPRRRVPVR